MKRIVKRPLALIMALSLLAGCSSGGNAGGTAQTQAQTAAASSTTTTNNSGAAAAAADVGKKDTLVIAMQAEPAAVDSIYAIDDQSGPVAYQIFDSLIRSMPDNTLVPGLAESWTYSDDKGEITFTLRKDVKFHNGETMTAEDVAFSLNTAIAAPQSANVAGFMEKAEVVDGDKVKLTLKQPYGPIEYCLATLQLSIFSKSAYEKDPEGFKRNPVGTGAYKFVEWKTADEITLEAFDDYYLGAPKIKTLVFKIIPDTDTQLLALEKGEVDMIHYLPMTSKSTIEGNPNIAIHEAEASSHINVTINNQDEILSNKLVRQAIAHAVDKEAMIIGSLDGNGEPSEAPISKGIFGYPDGVVTFREYDVEKAKALLAEAGYPNGLKLTITTADRDEHKKRAEILQDQLTAIGIDCSVETLEWGAFLDKRNSGAYQLTTGEKLATYPDADTFYKYYHSSAIGSGNELFTRNDQLDSILDRGRSSMDINERKGIYKELCDLWREECFTVPLMSKKVAAATNVGLKNVGENRTFFGYYYMFNFSWE